MCVKNTQKKCTPLKKMCKSGESWQLRVDSWGQLFIPSLFHFLEYRLLTPERSDNSYNSFNSNRLKLAKVELKLHNLTFGSVFFAPQIAQMGTDVLSCHAFFSHRFDFVELKVLSNCTDYCRRKRRWLMNKTSRMAGAIEAPTIRAIRKNLSEKKICVHLCNLWGEKYIRNLNYWN